MVLYMEGIVVFHLSSGLLRKVQILNIEQVYHHYIKKDFLFSVYYFGKESVKEIDMK